MQVGERFENNDGEFCTVTHYRNAHEVTVIFDNGHIDSFRSDHLRSGGFVNQSTYAMKGMIFTSRNCGDFEVIEDISRKNKKIRFIGTNTIVKTTRQNILKGEIKDRFLKLNHGGFLGVGAFNSNHYSYPVWCGMLNRCKNLRKDLSNITYITENVTVVDEWHNFQTFAQWFTSYCTDHRIQYDGDVFELDKDILSDGANKMYSPTNCCIIKKELNHFYRSVEHARGYKSSRNKGKPYTVSVGGKWITDTKTIEEAKIIYGGLKASQAAILFADNTYIIPEQVKFNIEKLLHTKFGAVINSQETHDEHY